jgi:hypothetical protein
MSNSSQNKGKKQKITAMTITAMAPAIALIFLVGSLVIVPTMNNQKAYAEPTLKNTGLVCFDPPYIVKITFIGDGYPPNTPLSVRSEETSGSSSGGGLAGVSTDSSGHFEQTYTYSLEDALITTYTVTYFVDLNGNNQVDSGEPAASTTYELTGTECDEPEKTPVELIQDLKATINSMTISKTLKTSLLGPLTNAEKLLTDKDSTNDHDACLKLNDFITSVNSKTGKKGGLTSAQAEELLSQAQAIKEAIGC